MARPSKRRRQELAQTGTTTVARPSGPPSRTASPTDASAAPRQQPSGPRGPGGAGRPAGPTADRYRTQRVEVRGPWWMSPWAWGGGLTVLVAVVVVVILLVSMAGAPAAGSGTNTPVPAGVLSAVTGVSDSVSNSIGSGGITNNLQKVTPPAAPLGSGVPQLVFVGADYCPYCAAERWSLVIALSRFGSFSNLHLTMSDSNAEDFPDTNTFTFYQSSYSSSYLKFEAVETEDRNGNPLQTPSAEVQNLVDKYDTSPYSSTTGGIPFVTLNNKYIISGSGYSPEILQGLTWQQIASDLSSTSSPVAQAIIGNANWITAGICSVTNDQPASVCSQSAITTLEGELGSS